MNHTAKKKKAGFIILRTDLPCASDFLFEWRSIKTHPAYAHGPTWPIEVGCKWDTNIDTRFDKNLGFLADGVEVTDGQRSARAPCRSIHSRIVLVRAEVLELCEVTGSKSRSDGGVDVRPRKMYREKCFHDHDSSPVNRAH